jgi:outer membrane protein
MKPKYMITLLLIFFLMNSISAQTALTLEQSKQLALKNNAQTKNSQLEIDAAKETKQAAFTSYFPSVSAGAFTFRASKDMMNIQTQGGNLPVYDGNLANLASATQFAFMPASTMSLLKKGTIGMISAVQPVYAGGRIVNGNRLASLGEEVSEYKNKLSQNEILLKTEEQYWQIVSLEEKLKTINKYEELLNNLQLQVEDAFNSGIVMRNDVLKVKLKKSEVLLNKSKLENGIKLASMAFCQLVGITYDSTLTLTDQLTTVSLPQSYFVDHSEALTKRSEYSLLQKSVDAEKFQTNIKRGEYLPQVGIGVSGVYMKLDEGKSNSFGMVFGVIQVPISGWWEASHTLSERSIKEQIAQNNLKDKSELLSLQMQKAWQDISEAYKQVSLSEESKAQAEENIKVNEDSYKNGLIKVSDLLEAQALLQQTKDQLTDSRTQYKIKCSYYLNVTGR